MSIVRKYSKHTDVAHVDSAVSVILMMCAAVCGLVILIAMLGTFAGAAMSGISGAWMWFLFTIMLVPSAVCALGCASLPSDRVVLLSAGVSVVTFVLLMVALPLGNSGAAQALAFFPRVTSFVSAAAEILIFIRRGQSV